MISPLRRHLSPLRSVSASLALIAFAGCETDRPRRGPPSAENGAPATAPIPELSGRGSFFAGQIEAEVLLSRTGFGARGGKDGSPPAEGGGPGHGGGGFSGGFGGKRGGGPRGGGGGGPSPGEGAGSASRSSDGAPTPRIVASNEPPVRLHLRLTNHGAAPVDVEVLDFNSALGNFVVQPAKLSVAPGASAEADPMTSRLGLTTDALPVTIRLRQSGRTEQQVVVLEKIPPPAPAPAVPPSLPAAP